MPDGSVPATAAVAWPHSEADARAPAKHSPSNSHPRTLRPIIALNHACFYVTGLTLKKVRRDRGGGASPFPSACRSHTPTKPGDPRASGVQAASLA